MNRLIFFIFLCLIVTSTNARQVITGKIIDKETSKPVEVASIELLELPDSIAVEVVATNTEGVFILYKVDTAKIYCLRIKHLSYKKALSPVAKKGGSMINDIGIITLESTTLNIKEIMVSSSKVRVTELADRTVYNIPDDMKKTSTDGLDMLRKLPSVQVDYFNENITVEGKTNIKLEVDGVSRDKESLKKLHPSQIDKLIIITSPSGKYDAEVDAVINIVTDKEMRYGLKGMVNTTLFPNRKDSYIARLNSNFDYGLKKISYYIAENVGVENLSFINDMQRYINNNSLQQNGQQSSEVHYGTINVGFICDPDELNNLNFNASYNKNKQNSDGNVINYQYDANNINKIYKTISSSKNDAGGINTSLYYKHKFNKNTQQNIEFETNYYNSLNNIGSQADYYNADYSLDMIEVYRNLAQTEKSNTNKQIMSIKSNYTLPFDSVYTFSTGVNANFNHYMIDNISSIANVPNLNYKDIRGWFFIELSKTYKKGIIKVGTRIERSHVNINSNDNKSYISPLPYINSQYKINLKNSVRFTYNRRIIRPLSNDLNPFVSAVDSQTISHGNINLRPSYRDNMQLSYNWKLRKGQFTGNFSPQIFYEYRSALIQRITTVMASTNKVENSPQNISNGYEIGVGLNINSQLAMVIFNSFLKYSYTHIDKYIDQIDEINKKCWNWNVVLTSPLPFKLRFFTVINVNSSVVNGQQESKTAPFYLFGLVKQFSNSSNLTFMAFNPFVEKFFNTTTIITGSNNFYQRSGSYMNVKNAIMLTYTYNFKIGKSINLEKRFNEQDNDDNGKNKLPFNVF